MGRTFTAEYMARELPGRPDLTGRKVHHLGWPVKYDEVFALEYAGWADEWIVVNGQGQEILRATGSELQGYLVKEG